MVRPFIEPSRMGRTLALPSSGDIQLLVGPASSWLRVQMKVTLSVRATSLGLRRFK